jgi:multidrug efflux pump subunit AcrB
MYVSEGLGNIISLLLGFFVVPMLAVNFFRKQTVESFFEFSVLNVVRDNLGEYIITVLKQYALVIIFMVLSIVLVGIPGMLFTNSIFVANMYGRLVERKAEASL